MCARRREAAAEGPRRRRLLLLPCCYSSAAAGPATRSRCVNVTAGTGGGGDGEDEGGRWVAFPRRAWPGGEGGGPRAKPAPVARPAPPRVARSGRRCLRAPPPLRGKARAAAGRSVPPRAVGARGRGARSGEGARRRRLVLVPVPVPRAAVPGAAQAGWPRVLARLRIAPLSGGGGPGLRSAPAGGCGGRLAR
ncbi:alanine and glycine-rich protein-like [Melospiza georgiana]|uniref:alanine and glycine-rich protein-like n=1 Tax=Melospiza georgiana TaxID=44398 RepID=UPI0025ACFEF9|nr:alanine and glycine-rich protein-like [Melospiza georgiana]